MKRVAEAGLTTYLMFGATRVIGSASLRKVLVISWGALLWAVVPITPAYAAGAVCDGPRADKLAAYKFVPGKAIDVAIEKPLAKVQGKSARGLKIMVNPERGNCIACHRVSAILTELDLKKSETPQKYGTHGTLGPSLDGIAGRYTIGELRAILVDAQAAFPEADTIMPPYYLAGKFVRAFQTCKDRAILSARDIEDVLAYLSKLK